MNPKSVVLLTASIFITYGCTSIANIDSLREEDSKLSDSDMNHSKKRSLKISNGQTYFSKPLQCVGETLQNLESKALSIKKSKGISTKNHIKLTNRRISVDNIIDKTSKIYASNESPLSDIVMHSLSKLSLFEVVETPIGSSNILKSRNQFSSAKYPVELKNKKGNLSGISYNNYLPVGVLFPSDNYISGALIRYDENFERPVNDSIKIDADWFSATKDVSKVTIGLNLRLIDSKKGTVARVGNQLGSINLTSNFYKIKLKNNLFKLINTKDYGINYDITVSDPMHYMVQEIADKGVLELLTLGLDKKLFSKCFN